MSNIRKLSAFRQLSLNCNSPTAEQRRKSFKKQFSEDLPDLKPSWLDPGLGIKISVNAKSSRNLDRPPPIKIAWEEPSELKAEDAVIIKKCKEVRRASTGKLSRQTSLEKDSILHSKQELAERLRQNAREQERQKEHEKQKEQEKRNLKIFLGQNSIEHKETFFKGHREEKTREGPPKLIQPLITNDARNPKNLFQIRRGKPKINLHEITYSPTRRNELNTSIPRRDTVVVVPLVEKETTELENVEATKELDEVLKPIDSIIIRPSTAASRREKFQKRTNSAFNATIKESHPRPTLTRSSSAPANGKSKFVATKRKIKSAKRAQLKNALLGDASEANNKENPKSQKELNRTTAVNGSDVVTMVSLVSPAGSEGEEEMVEEPKEKSVHKSSSEHGNKSRAKEGKEVSAGLPLRKIVKTGKSML